MLIDRIMQIIVIGTLLYLVYKSVGNNAIAGRFGKSESKGEVLIDTSILIDGRILSVAKTGFLGFKVVIPRSVVGELQLLADGGSDEKRTRARFGLDIISALQNTKGLKVEILQDGTSASEGVDNRLINLAKQNGAKICTADYNLNKVAKVEGIEVLNINELAQSVRAQYLPGEKLMLELTQKGNEKKQAIGHLPDGTMVVVENAEQLVGTLVEVEFIRMLQTAAGKMMFAKIYGTKLAKIENKKTIGRKQNVRMQTKTAPKKDQEQTAEKQIEQKNETKIVQKPKNQIVKNENLPKNKSEKKPARRRRKSPEDSMVALANKK